MTGVVDDAASEDEWSDYRHFLEQLLQADDIEGQAAKGITKKVVAEGLVSLSANQLYVFKREVQGNFPQPRCEECRELIPWSEAYEHVHAPGRCSSCQHRYDKFME